ncbi:unannotated protein [freshwater metagenome]|uniref:Unannotated protein n=1 Tax=freshwater metagenome TaxID=449393 RepID=A0A6J7F189_9ZZZZ|nr:hypothetical protein [Actinomycetota bacterium]
MSDHTSDYSQYREHLSAEQINAVLRHGHIIPMGRGWTREYLAEHHPGWTFKALLDVFNAAGVRGSGGGCAGICVAGVKYLHFNDDTSFEVERIDAAEVEQ